MSLAHISWRCARCGSHHSTTLGSKWILLRGKKSRICAACVQLRAESKAVREAATPQIV